MVLFGDFTVNKVQKNNKILRWTNIKLLLLAAGDSLKNEYGSMIHKIPRKFNCKSSKEDKDTPQNYRKK